MKRRCARGPAHRSFECYGPTCEAMIHAAPYNAGTHAPVVVRLWHSLISVVGNAAAGMSLSQTYMVFSFGRYIGKFGLVFSKLT